MCLFEFFHYLIDHIGVDTVGAPEPFSHNNPRTVTGDPSLVPALDSVFKDTSGMLTSVAYRELTNRIVLRVVLVYARQYPAFLSKKLELNFSCIRLRLVVPQFFDLVQPEEIIPVIPAL